MMKRQHLPALRTHIAVLSLLLGGCATDRPKPLPPGSDLARAPKLTVPANGFAVPGLEPHPIDPSQGLDLVAVAELAVLNNPDLRAQRLQADIANAQVIDAGLLPDPELSVGLTQSPEHRGYSLGLGEELQAIVTRGARRGAAQTHARKVNLEILWQEWQVAEKARELSIEAASNEQLRRVLGVHRELLAERYRRDRAAMEQGAITAGIVTADFSALSDADAQIRDLALQANEASHALHLLLGLRPDVPLRLIGPPDAEVLTRAEFDSAVAALPRRRADLLALQAGYASEEEQVRAAILAQFPTLTAGVDRGRSAEEGISTVGINVNLTLPLFNANRGKIRIEQATRAALHQAYQARLDEAIVTADQTWQSTGILSRQLSGLEAALPSLEKAAAEAEGAYHAGYMSLDVYASQRANMLTQQENVIRLRASLARAQSALTTLLGRPFSPPPIQAARSHGR